MEQRQKQSTENFIKDIRRKSRRLFSSEQKLIIVMEAQRGENSVTEICRKHGISQATKISFAQSCYGFCKSFQHTNKQNRKTN